MFNLETMQRQKPFEVDLVIDDQPVSMEIDTRAFLSFLLKLGKTFGQTDACNLPVLD